MLFVGKLDISRLSNPTEYSLFLSMFVTGWWILSGGKTHTHTHTHTHTDTHAEPQYKLTTSLHVPYSCGPLAPSMPGSVVTSV